MIYAVHRMAYDRQWRRTNRPQATCASIIVICVDIGSNVGIYCRIIDMHIRLTVRITFHNNGKPSQFKWIVCYVVGASVLFSRIIFAPTSAWYIRITEKLLGNDFQLGKHFFFILSGDSCPWYDTKSSGNCVNDLYA